MKLRKVMALSLAGAMAVSLGACGGGGGSESGGDSGSGGGDGSLSVMIWDTYQEPGLTEILNDFTEETGIEAEIQVVTWDDYWTLLSAGAQGGSMPDVFWMHSNEAERYMSNEMLLDLTDRIAESDGIYILGNCIYLVFICIQILNIFRILAHIHKITFCDLICKIQEHIV